MPESPSPLGMLAPDADKKPASLGLFAKKPKDTGQTSPQLQDVINEVNSTSRRLRVVEDRFTNVRDKLQLMEQNQIQIQRNVLNELRAVNSDVLEMKRSLREMDVKIMNIVGEVSQAAQKQEVGVLKRYIEIWDPMRFVTAEQVERIVKELLEENGVKIEPKA